VSSPILADKAFARATITNFFFFFSLNCFILLPLYIEGAGGTEIEIGIVMGLYITHGIGYAFMWTILASLLLLGSALSMSLTDRRVA